MIARPLLLAVAGAALCITPVLAGGTASKTTTSSAANAAWCRSTEAGLSNLDATKCAERMNAAKTESERKEVQSAFLSGGSAASQSSGGRPSTAPSGTNTTPSMKPDLTTPSTTSPQ